MTLRDERPVNKCAVRGCPFLGRWDAGDMCPEHRRNPLTDKVGARTPSTAEYLDAPDSGRG